MWLSIVDQLWSHLAMQLLTTLQYIGGFVHRKPMIVVPARKVERLIVCQSPKKLYSADKDTSPVALATGYSDDHLTGTDDFSESGSLSPAPTLSGSSEDIDTVSDCTTALGSYGSCIDKKTLYKEVRLLNGIYQRFLMNFAGFGCADHGRTTGISRSLE
jgi:hypothetical protein